MTMTTTAVLPPAVREYLGTVILWILVPEHFRVRKGGRHHGIKF